MFERVARAFLLRRVSRALDRIAAALDRQAALLERLCDHLAPLPRPVDPPLVARDTGISHLDQQDAALALAFVERMRAQTGYTPDDDEILIHLADEKTTDLQTRLAHRAEQLAAIDADRRQWRSPRGIAATVPADEGEP